MIFFERCLRATFEHGPQNNFAQCQRNASSWRHTRANLNVFVSYIACPTPVASSRASSFQWNISSCGSRHVCLPQASNNYPDHLPTTQIQMERPWHPCALPTRQKSLSESTRHTFLVSNKTRRQDEAKDMKNVIHIFRFSIKLFLMDSKCVRCQ